MYHVTVDGPVTGPSMDRGYLAERIDLISVRDFYLGVWSATITLATDGAV